MHEKNVRSTYSNHHETGCFSEEEEHLEKEPVIYHIYCIFQHGEILLFSYPSLLGIRAQG